MWIKTYLPAIACFLVAAVIFAFAEGNRRIYSTIFFAMIGVVMWINARRRPETKSKN